MKIVIISFITTDNRPYIDSILGRNTPFDTKVADVVCDDCGEVVIADVKLQDLHELLSWWKMDRAIDRHRKEMLDRIRDKVSALKKETNSTIIIELRHHSNYHKQYTLRWIPIIEQRLKEMGVFY
jgi:hypothetical protein